MALRTRKKTTLAIDESLLRAAKVHAARTGKREYQVLEEALASYLGLSRLRAIQERNALSPEEAEKLAYEELHRHRPQRHGESRGS